MILFPFLQVTRHTTHTCLLVCLFVCFSVLFYFFVFLFSHDLIRHVLFIQKQQLLFFTGKSHVFRLKQVKLDKRRHFESLLKRCSTWGPEGGSSLDKELPAMLGKETVMKWSLNDVV